MTGHFSACCVYGLDITGLLHGYFDVGGLLATRLENEYGFCVYDNHGNVSDFIQGNISNRVSWMYAPFGTFRQTERCTGISFNFSSKYWDGEINAYHYGYRFYSPHIARWLSRDPLGERADIALYRAIKNDAQNNLDGFGLSCQSVRDERFSTPEEQAKITAMRNGDPPCPEPRIVCRCCNDSTETGYTSNNLIVICERDGDDERSDDEYRATRKHELSHVFDRCKGAQLGCQGSELEQLICSELRAYSWGTGLNNREQVISRAVKSVKHVCLRGRVDNGAESLYSAMAEGLYNQCTGLDNVAPIPSSLSW